MKRKPPGAGGPAKPGLARTGFGRKTAGPKTLSAKSPRSSKSSFTTKPKPGPDGPRAGGLKAAPPDRREMVKRAALNALRRAQRAAAKAGIELSEWEDEFLGSVQDRVKTYGRAFGDPDKGAPGQALSVMQAVKLKEIAAKANGEPRHPPRRRRAPRPASED